MAINAARTSLTVSSFLFLNLRILAVSFMQCHDAGYAVSSILAKRFHTGRTAPERFAPIDLVTCECSDATHTVKVGYVSEKTTRNQLTYPPYEFLRGNDYLAGLTILHSV